MKTNTKTDTKNAQATNYVRSAMKSAIKESRGITAPKAQNGFVCVAKIQNFTYFLHLLCLFL